MRNAQKGFMSPLLLALVALILIGTGAYVYVYVQNNQTNQAVVTQTSTTYDLVDLGVKFTLPNTFADLTHKVVKLFGDQAVSSVEFSSKRLEVAGCDLDMAPLGYLTYDNDKGGIILGHARGSGLYYIKPDGKCKADASLQNWQDLENALKSLASDAQSNPTAQVSSSNPNMAGGLCPTGQTWSGPISSGGCVSQTTQTTSTALPSSSQPTERFFTPFPAWAGLTLTLPARAEIKDNVVNIDNSEFRFGGGVAGLCPPTPGSEVGGSIGYSNGVNCTYEDDQTLNNITVLRIWKDSRGIFALNPQGVPITDPTADFVIVKTKPNQIFTASEVTFWKGVLSRIK